MAQTAGARARGSQQVLAACPFSASQREHLPFMGVKDGPFKMTMGVQPMDWNDWIEIDEWYEEEIELKRQMLAEKKDRVLQEDPEAKPASQELLQSLCAWLPSHYPDRFVYEDGRIHNRATGDCFDTRDPALNPLYAASMLVQEDIALMYKGRLVGGGVCFPMRWSLMNYMGKDIPELHEKVPHFNDTIVGQVSAFLDKLKPERPFTRANWGIDPNPDLDQHPPQTDEEKEEAMQRAMSRGPITVENAGNFKNVVAKRPEVATKLSKALCQLSPEFAEYKTMTGPVKEVALDYLENVSANPSELLVTA
ncbi:hypothetical protein DUNSADRAFT_10752 [Dunaliella salina]|uniref:Uncharacterized protein n=1 Tax=Dunaliella salina TaxID=3046 RepID=A0ABQ7GEL1_DUNSA|nr:hypothetical protein DUNSADRAFT_10752 [Dunaliella salina]|eukprot:KAF5833046.1 hypothetical protein DUNSADRAFT_10752 [Dunaliella salina]